MVKATVEYVCDWQSRDNDDQRGHIKVTTPTGVIEGTWSATGGMGDGAELVSNTTQEYTDDEAYTLLNAADLCQGCGTYTATLGRDQYGHDAVTDVEWAG